MNGNFLSISTALFLILLLPSAVEAAGESTTIKGYPLEFKAYSIQSIPFERHEISAEGERPAIIFAQYAAEAKAVYPPPKDKIPANAGSIIKRCQVALKDSIDKIVNAQEENNAIKNYLSLDGKIRLFKKEDYFHLINSPQEQTVQVEPVEGNIIAEFRSQEIAVDADNSFCLYMTFVYGNGDMLDEIIISAVRLTGEN